MLHEVSFTLQVVVQQWMTLCSPLGIKILHLFLGASVSKYPRLGDIKQQKFILTFLEARHPKSSFWQGHAFSGLPWWLSGKESTSNSGDLGSIPGLKRSPGEGKSNPLQYSWLGKPMDRGAW